MTTTQEGQWVTCKDAAKIIGVSHATFWKILREEKENLTTRTSRHDKRKKFINIDELRRVLAERALPD